jgi:hypothetical protein
VQGDQIERIFAYWTQGDQIVRIFAQWAIVYFGHFFKYYRRNQKIWPTFSLNIDNVLILTKKIGGATFRAIFCTNSSGHPDWAIV